MNFLFNEQSAVEKLISMKNVDNDNVFTTIKDLARYNHFVLGIDDNESYKSILKYLKANGDNINEESVYQIINDCVKKAKKYPFMQVDEVSITQSELDFIVNLNDIKREKIAFVLLAAAKYYDAVRGAQRHTAYMRNSDICKLARVTIPVEERNVFMQFAYDLGVLSRHSRASSTEKKVLFVSQKDDDKVVLRLQESDYKDLAYTYLAYKTPHMFRRCVVCNCWIKRGTKDVRVCKRCASTKDTESITVKEIRCIDCGTSVYVSVLNTKTCRCDECQDVYRKNYMKELMREKRVSTTAET